MWLAIETSCDETAVALYAPGRGLVGEWLQTQIALHGPHGGVVPDLAAREHLRTLAPLIALGQQAGEGRIDAIAVTRGPGLAACLAIGVAAAKALALAWQVPVWGLNHLRGHLWSPFLTLAADGGFAGAVPDDYLPHLGLIVSGGHTLLAVIDTRRQVHLLSSTRDDAAGEALDKGAKLLGLGYPGGPLIEQRARGGRPAAFDFPRGLPERAELDFSFSGLKTSLRYCLEKMTPEEVRRATPDLCASYQEAVVDALAKKTRAALQTGSFRSLGLSGGVARNGRVREALAAEAGRRKISFLAARPEHTGDNAGMIAFAAAIDPPPWAEAQGMGLKIDPSLSLVDY